MIKEPFKRSLTIIAYVYMFNEPFKQFLSIIAYVYLLKEPFKRSLTNIAYAYMFKDRTYHLTMVKVDIWAAQYQPIDLTIISVPYKFQLHICLSFREKQF